MKVLLRVAAVAAVLLLLLAAAALGPALLRTDAVVYEWAGSFGEEILQEPVGLTRVGERLYVSDAGRNALVVFDTAGDLIAEWNGDGERFLRPMNVRAVPGPHLLVPEYLADRVTVLDTAGEVVRILGGTTGSAPGELDAPGGAAEIGGETWVADFYNHRVQAFGPDGGVRVIGRPGRILPGRLHYPTDVASSGDSLHLPTSAVPGGRGDLFVADFGNGGIVRFQSTIR